MNSAAAVAPESLATELTTMPGMAEGSVRFSRSMNWIILPFLAVFRSSVSDRVNLSVKSSKIPTTCRLSSSSERTGLKV